MATSTKIRLFSRLIDKSSAPLWVIGPDGRLAFLSAAVGDWLTVEPEALVGRRCVAGSSITDDPLDYLAASLAAPPGVATAGTASLLVQPTLPGARARSVDAMETRFVRLGDGDDSITIAIGGEFRDQQVDPAIETAVEVRQQLDTWRKHHEAVVDSVIVGSSRAARRTQNQIRLASSVRADVTILSPPGCFSDSIATAIHSRSSGKEPSVTVDGPLMDAELLDASMAPAIAHLSESETNHATALIKDIDQTPADAQQRLDEHARQFGHRLRLIALAGPSATVRSPTAEESKSDPQPFLDESPPLGIDSNLADRLAGLCIRVRGLAERVEDIPMIATAILDRRRAGGDGTADRFSRAALDALVIYPWPDNVRELDQAIRHAIHRCRGDSVTPDHLPLAIRSYRPHESTPAERAEIDLDHAVAQFEAGVIQDTLEACDGNRAEAARRLRISRARLLRKLDLIDGGDGR